MRYNFITIEGCIGAGKTTLSSKIAKDFNGRLILEHFEENPFLPKFYEDPERHAFPVELYFMAERFQHLKSLLSEPALFSSFAVSDFLFQKSLIFASNNLKTEEAKLYRLLFDIINSQLPKPDLVLYLYAPIEKLLKNIQTRGRIYEQQIQADYLQNIQQAYLDYFKFQHQSKILLLDTSELNFLESETDYNSVISILNKEYPEGITYIT